LHATSGATLRVVISYGGRASWQRLQFVSILSCRVQRLLLGLGLEFIEVGVGSRQNLPSGYPMIVPSLRSCLAGLPTCEATAEVGQLLRWRRVRADGERPKDTVIIN